MWTEEVSLYALVCGGVPLEVVEVVAGVAALLAVILPHVLVNLDDMLVQHLLVGAHEVVAVGAQVASPSFRKAVRCFQMYFHFTLPVGMEIALRTIVLALP